MDIPIEGLHTESGPGVYEAAITYSEALTLADRAFLFKTTVKQIAQKHGKIASFMAKPYNDLPGCSGHIHVSLVDALGKNQFESFGSDERLSTLARHFVAGLLAGLPSMMAVYAPNINR